MELVSAEHFSAAAGEEFDLALGGSRVALTLTDIQSLGGSPERHASRRPFALLFKSALSVILPQQIYALHNKRLGTIGIFLVPVARDRDGIVYQAVFN